MTRKVHFSPRALDDLDRLEDFLVEKNINSAIRAIDTILEAAASLADLSERGPSGDRSRVRRLIVPFGRNGYVIEYRVDPDRVIVARVFHSLEDRPLA